MKKFHPRCASLLLGLLQTCPAAADAIFYHSDALGSPVAATDSSGNVLWRARYRPYGERDQSAADYAASANNPLWYGGHGFDDASGLAYLQARFYSPFSGRFLSPDPAPLRASDPETFNRYAYARNNPYRYVDPDGRESVSVNLKASGAFGGGGSLSTGIYISYPGDTEVPFDIGLTSTVAGVLGAEASLTLNVAALEGGRENLEGQVIGVSATLPLTGIVGPAVDAELLINPETGQAAGSSLGVGIAALPSASASMGESSIDFSLRDTLTGWFGDDPQPAQLLEDDIIDALWYSYITG